MDIVRAASGVTAGREWSRDAMDAFLSQWVVGGGCAHIRAGYWFSKRSRNAEVVLDPVTAPWTGTVFAGPIEIEVGALLLVQYFVSSTKLCVCNTVYILYVRMYVYVSIHICMCRVSSTLSLSNAVHLLVSNTVFVSHTLVC
jgi:hypothetical protein